MSVFTSRVTKTIEIPHDAGQSITIRKLNPRALDKAAKASQIASLEELRAMGGPAFLKELRGLSDNDVKAAVSSDPLLRFDRIILIEKGVSAWSYPDPLTKESFEDLDDETAEFIAREVLRLAKPSLFQTGEEAETERKNG